MATKADPKDQPIIEAEEPEVPSPDVPETPEPEVPAPEPEAEPEAEPEVPEPEVPEAEEKPPSRRELKRIDQILAKREASQQAPSHKRQDALDYEKSLDADPEVIKQLEADRRAAEVEQYNAGLQQANTLQWNTRLEIDAPVIEAKYKFLDPNDTQEYDPVRSNAMIRLYLNHVGYTPPDPEKGVRESVENPHVRYRDFVEAQMEFAEALMADSTAKTSKNIAKQTAATGLRPDGSSAKRLNLDRDPSDMTMEELYASIGQKPPK